MAIKYVGAEALGSLTVRSVFHGSPCHFDTFDCDRNHSIGIHFGDLDQAKYFAGEKGQIIKADLEFKNLFDVKKSDLGWTSEIAVATALRDKMMRTVGIIPEAFEKIATSDLSSVEWKITTKMSGASVERLIRLLELHDIDGIKYTNLVEPPERPGGEAYFVLRAVQVTILDVDRPVSGKFEAKKSRC